MDDQGNVMYGLFVKGLFVNGPDNPKLVAVSANISKLDSLVTALSGIRSCVVGSKEGQPVRTYEGGHIIIDKLLVVT